MKYALSGIGECRGPHLAGSDSMSEQQGRVNLDTLREKSNGSPGAADVVQPARGSSVNMSHRCSNNEFTANAPQIRRKLSAVVHDSSAALHMSQYSRSATNSRSQPRPSTHHWIGHANDRS